MWLGFSSTSMVMKFMLEIALLLALVAGGSEAVYKRWLQDTDWESPLNWNRDRAPCGNDKVIVPDDSPVIYLQTNTTLQEITLPKDGVIVLGNYVQLGFTQQPSPNCQSSGGDVEFIAIHPESWFKPDNWCATNTEEGDCLPSSIVDTENVPCKTDDVVFLRNRAYYVTMNNNLQLTVKSLKITGTSFTTSTFTDFLNSDDGKTMFKPPSSGNKTSVIISRQGCDDLGGCACGNDQGQMMEQICAIKTKTCPRSLCYAPVTPVGSCCDRCGAILSGTRGRGFNLNSFNNNLKPFLALLQNVTSAVSITGQGRLQLVLTDDNGGTDSIKLAIAIKKDIDQDLKSGGHKYALDTISITAESGASTAGHTGDEDKGLKPGPIAGIIFGIIVLAVIAVVAFLIYKRGKPNLPSLPNLPNFGGLRAFEFYRFKNQRQPPSGQSTPPMAGFDPGFNNPLYGSAPFDDGNTQELVVVGSYDEQPTFDMGGPNKGFNNPMYGTSAALKENTSSFGAEKPDLGINNPLYGTPGIADSAKPVTVDCPDDDDSKKQKY